MEAPAAGRLIAAHTQGHTTVLSTYLGEVDARVVNLKLDGGQRRQIGFGHDGAVGADYFHIRVVGVGAQNDRIIHPCGRV